MNFSRVPLSLPESVTSLQYISPYFAKACMYVKMKRHGFHKDGIFLELHWHSVMEQHAQVNDKGG